jgi:hypothetical protein
MLSGAIAPEAYKDSVRHGYVYSRGVQERCTPRVLGRDQPKPSHHMLVVSMYSVRHGYDLSRGVHFSCTPPLYSCGVQKFLYATEDNSSYSYFPSSES